MNGEQHQVVTREEFEQWVALMNLSIELAKVNAENINKLVEVVQMLVATYGTPQIITDLGPKARSLREALFE